MGVVPIDNLAEGMILGKDVHDRSGRLLLGAGAELTQKHLHIFRTWGIAEAWVEGVEEEEVLHHQLPPEVTPEAVAAAEETLKPLFRHADLAHPAIRELLRLRALEEVCHGTS